MADGVADKGKGQSASASAADDDDEDEDEEGAEKSAKRKLLSPEERTTIIELLGKKVPLDDILKQTGRGKRTVERVANDSKLSVNYSTTTTPPTPPPMTTPTDPATAAAQAAQAAQKQAEAAAEAAAAEAALRKQKAAQVEQAGTKASIVLMQEQMTNEDLGTLERTYDIGLKIRGQFTKAALLDDVDIENKEKFTAWVVQKVKRWVEHGPTIDLVMKQNADLWKANDELAKALVVACNRSEVVTTLVIRARRLNMELGPALLDAIFDKAKELWQYEAAEEAAPPTPPVTIVASVELTAGGG